MTNSSQFIWDFPCFSTKSLMSWEIPQSQANEDRHLVTLQNQTQCWILQVAALQCRLYSYSSRASFVKVRAPFEKQQTPKIKIGSYGKILMKMEIVNPWILLTFLCQQEQPFFPYLRRLSFSFPNIPKQTPFLKELPCGCLHILLGICI